MLNKFRLNIQVLAEALLLLAVTMGILAYFSHKALREEAMRDAEQTLDGTIQTIDNILQTAFCVQVLKIFPGDRGPFSS